MPNEVMAGREVFRNDIRRMGGSSTLSRFLERFSIDTAQIVDEEFSGLTLDTGDYTLGNGGGASAASPAITAGTVNGVADFITGTAGDSTASSQIATGLQVRGDLSPIFVARFTVDIITGVKVEAGFTDALNDAGAVATKATPTMTASDAAVWILDTNDNANWEGVAANNGSTSPATTVEAAISPTAGTYEYLMVELREYDATNSVCAARYRRFSANGGLTYTSGWQADGPNSNVALTPWVYVEARNASSKTLSLDYLGVWQRRTET